MRWDDPAQACPLDHLAWSPPRPSYFDPEQPRMWNPRTPEDRLLAHYPLPPNPACSSWRSRFGQGDDYCGPRRLDGLLIPGGESHIRVQGSYSRADIAAAMEGQYVHVIEAKRKLNRTVVGQEHVGVVCGSLD